MGVRVLVIGSGGREHALCLALRRDPSVDTIFASPGNPGMADLAGLMPAGDVVETARAAGADLVIIGPEAPLVAGVADRLRDAGFSVFGPSAAAAQIEGSKAFAKDVMAAAGVPTARHWVCRTSEELAEALDTVGPPYVVKHDELAAGKGVVVTPDRAAAEEHALGHTVVVEEFLDGPEASLFCVTDGNSVVPLLPAQDFKRVGDDETGPNTGGMGAYTPLPWAPSGLADDVVKTIVQPVVDEMARRGAQFSGLLYAGLALTSRGPMVIEFNARFGDPETQVVLPLLETPLAGLLHAAATGGLAAYPPLTWYDGAAVTVVVASEGYPASPVTGDVIEGIDVAEAEPGVSVIQAGTTHNLDGDLITAGGRVLAVTAVAPDLAHARESAYRAVDGISIRGAHHRGDIALRAVRGQISVP
jgi:phosphoribosylamine---glycine ligase